MVEGNNQGHEFDHSFFYYYYYSFLSFTLCHLIHPQWDVVRIMQNQWLSPQHAKTKWMHLPVSSYPCPITCYQGLFKSLIAFNPDEHWLRSIATHLQPLMCTQAHTHTLRYWFGDYSHIETKVTTLLFKRQKTGSTRNEWVAVRRTKGSRETWANHGAAQARSRAFN